MEQFERRHFREISTDSATEQKAMKVIAAFAAWEYSHCVLSTSQIASGEQEERVSAADDLSGAIILLSARLDRSGPSADLALRPQEGLIVLIPS